MPIYKVKLADGRIIKIDSPRPPTEDDVNALLGGAPPEAPAPEAPPPTAPKADEGGILDAVWRNTRTPVKTVFEVAGRPGEFVQGAIAGTLKDGLGAGLKRGWDALTEGEFADSKIEEHTSKTLDESGILSDSPKTRAAVGFLGDAVSDPLNLAGGAGIIRRGLVAAGVPRAALGLTLGDKYQKGVKAGGRALEEVVAEVAPKLMQDSKLRVLRNAAGESAYDMKRVAGGKARAEAESIITHILTDPHNAMFKGVSEADRKAISYAISYPNSPEALRIAADPKLTAVANDVRKMTDDIFDRDVAATLLPDRKGITLTPSQQAKLDAMTPAQLAQLERVVQQGKVLNLPKKHPLAKVAGAIRKQASITEGTEKISVADLTSLKLTKDPATGEVVADFSSKMPNYLGHYIPGKERHASVFPSLKTKLNEAKDRVTTFNQAVAKGAPDDAAEILIRRAQNSSRANIDSQLIKDYVSNFGSARGGAGLTTLDQSVLEGLPELVQQEILKAPFLPQAIVDDITKFSVRIKDPEAMGALLHKGTKLFKTLATSMNLGAFQMNNYLGNLTNMYGSGMSADQVIREYAKATSVIKAKGKYTPINIGGVAKSHDEIMDIARQNGIYGHVSGYAGELGKVPTKGSARIFDGPYNLLNADNKVYREVTNWGQKTVEDPAKLGMFVHELKQGKSIDEAVLSVKNTLFDYAELSDVEKKIRTFIPFYTWTRKNLPLQVALLAKNPKSAAHQGRFIDLATQLSNGDEKLVPENQIPDYLNEGTTIQSRVGGVKDPVLLNFRTPLADLNLLSSNVPRTMGKLVGMVNPILKTPIEVAFQRHFDTGQPFKKGVGPSGLLGRMLGPVGVGAYKPDGTHIQPNLDRYLMDQLPIPAGSILRSVGYEGEEGAMPFGAELVRRAVGAQPQVLTREMRKKALQRSVKLKKDARAQKKADAAYQKLRD